MKTCCPSCQKQHRLDAFVFQYPGVNIMGAGEPSSALTDKFAQMVKHRQVKCLAWSKLTSREDEVLAKKRAQIKSVPIKWTGDCAGITASADSLPEVTTELESDYQSLPCAQGLTQEVGGRSRGRFCGLHGDGTCRGPRRGVVLQQAV
eukprot:3658712-Amphidinium_carterae.1